MGLKSFLESRRPGGTLGKVLLYELIGAFCASLFILFYRVRVRGSKNIPTTGPLTTPSTRRWAAARTRRSPIA